ncbi:hypothetical protein BJ944DRAFT_243314, partial [Cunninghamella echinulata]
DKLLNITGIKDRAVALDLGRAIGNQGCFYDVEYENALLDSTTEIYQFKDSIFYNIPIQKRLDFNQFGDPFSSNGNTRPGTMTTSSSSISNFSLATEDRFTITTANTTIDEEDHDDLDPLRSNNINVTKANNINTTAPYSINGIFTPLTRCYVPTCIGPEPCYSATCAFRHKYAKKLSNADSKLTPHTYLQKREQALWRDTVTDDILESISSTEKKRQEAIYELIYTESNFIRDLDYICKMWIDPILSGDVIPFNQQYDFVNKVFSNIREIQEVHSKFSKALRKRQQTHPIVWQIGDIVLKHAQNFHLIIEYGTRQHEARFVYEKERCLNPKFDQFAKNTEHHRASHKLELNGYLSKPTSRLGKYTLLIDAILKRTSPDHPDYESLTSALNVIKNILTQVNTHAGNAKDRFDLEKIHQHLTFKRKSDKLDLKLLEPGRRIIREGNLNKRPHLDSSDYHVLLFDHYLVIAEVKIIRGEKHYHVVKRPLSVAFLSVSIPEYTPSPQRTGSLLKPTRYHYTINRASFASQIKQGHPIHFQHMGRKKHGHARYTLYATSTATRKPWIDNIHQLQVSNQSISNVINMQAAIKTGQFKYKKINHVMPFQNNQLLVFAADDGIYAGKNSSDGVVHKVLRLEKATQIHVIEEFQMLLILADKTLWQYELTDVMNGKIDETCSNQPNGIRLQNNVPFFYVGTSLQRTLVCIPKVSSLKSVITVLEPCKPQSMTDKKPKLLERLVRQAGNSSSISSTQVYLKKFKEYYIPCESWAVELKATKLWITGYRGIMLIDLQKPDRTQQMLDPNDPHLTFVTCREQQESSLKIRIPVKHISVFKTPLNNFLMCYDEYAFYINSSGNRIRRDFLIEWEGCAESYALLWPYVIAIESTLIEIRSAETGQLEQVIRGEKIRCLYRSKDVIYGVMSDPKIPNSEYIFKLSVQNSPTLNTTITETTI